MKKISKRVFLCLVVITASFFQVAHAADTTTVVTPYAPDGWWFYQQIPTGSGAFVVGTSTPPLGTGSVEMTTNSPGRELFGTFAFVGTRLDAITSLSYSTYRSSSESALIPALQFDIDTDITDANTALQGQLTYDPVYTHPIHSGIWKTWDTLDSSSTGDWWISGGPGSIVCPVTNPCNWVELLAAFPNIGIRSAGVNTGATQFFAGGPGVGNTGGFLGNVDAFIIGISGSATTYDFELPAVAPPPPASPSSGSSSHGTINVVKTVINDNGGIKKIADFPLFVNGSSVISGETNNFVAPASAYTMTETKDANYVQTFSGDCDINGQLNLNPGDNRFCIITNNDIGAPIVVSPIPPLMALVKTANPLALPAGPGPVTYTYTLRNIGTVPVTDITIVGDTCSPIVLASGDTNGDNQLGLNETWVHHCTANLTETHTNTAVATGWANGVSTVDIANATVIVGAPIVPPLIHVTKIPSPLALSAGGGMVTYTNMVTNPGFAPLSNVRLTDDKCGPVTYISGDLNGDEKLDVPETWIYSCSSNLSQTTTNIITASGEANGLTVRDFAVATVVVGTPGFPNTGGTVERSLSLGSSGTDVIVLQTALEQQGFLVMPAGIPKGYFGTATEAAVIKYQTSVGLPQVGIFGPATRAKLFSGDMGTVAVPVPAVPFSGKGITKAEAIPVFVRSLSIGTRGADVIMLQTILEQKGFLTIPVGVAKGYFGPLTKSTVTRYQASVGLPQVGIFGPLTRAKLISELSD